MPSNAEIRTLQFMQGVEVDQPSSVLDDTGNKIVINNASNQSTGLVFNALTYREVVITYTMRRRTDATALAGDVIIEKGQIRLTSNPDAALLANKWIKDHEEQRNEGISPGVTFDLDITDDGDGNAVVDLLYSSSNLSPSAGHNCIMSYALKSFLV